MQRSHSKQLSKSRGICVILPTYNNVGSIAHILERVKAQCDDVIVVNDGSNDGTEDILQSMSGITVVDNKKNEGKGTALKRGFQKALELGFSYAITLDADGQHYPEDIPLMLEANQKNPGAIIIGKRNLEGVDRSKGSKFANAFSNFWFCVQTFHYLPDTQSGYRLYPLRKLKGWSFLTSRYEAELELLVFASWHGVKIVPIDINVFYPPKEEYVSHFRPALDFTRIFILNTILCLLAIIYGLPWGICRFTKTVFNNVFAILIYLMGCFGIITPFALVYVPIRKCLSLKSNALHGLLHRIGSIICWLLRIVDVKVSIQNHSQEKFEKPAIMICNHQSHLDLMVQLSLTRKIVFLTNDWVWKSPFFGYVIRHAEYYPVSAGLDVLKPKLKALIDKGYCISIFPEGTRSRDCTIGRFHKGAFQLAEELNVDILPVIIHGAGRALPKGGLYMRKFPITLTIEERITPEQLSKIGATTVDKSKWFRHHYEQRYTEVSNQIEKYV